VWEAFPSGPTPVSKVEFLIDNVVKTIENSRPYRYNGDSGVLNTTTLANGPHTLLVRSKNSAGTILASYTAGVTVSNGMTVSNTAGVMTVGNTVIPPPPPPTTTTTKALSTAALAAAAIPAPPGVYYPVAADVGHQMILKVTATNSSGSAVAVSAPSQVVQAAIPLTGERLVDPGFEGMVAGSHLPTTGLPTFPDRWSVEWDSPTVVTSGAHSGSKALFWQPGTGGKTQLQQLVAIEPNKNYVLTVWMKFSSQSFHGVVDVRGTGIGGPTDTVDADGDGYYDRGAPLAFYTVPSGPEWVNTWKKITVQFNSGNERNGVVRFESSGINGLKAGSSVYIDEWSLIGVP
jgi:hypothetical protein